MGRFFSATRDLSMTARPSLRSGGRRAQKLSTLHTGPLDAFRIERNYNERIMELMASDPSNGVCADCAAKLGSDAWASVSLGVFLCIRCCGAHRSLGVHISRCMSVDLDEWSAEQVAGMKGNAASNAVFEAYVPPGRFRPLESDPCAFCAEWVRAKYCEREFVAPFPGTVTAQSYEFMAREAHVWKNGRRSSRWRLRVERGALVAEAPPGGSTGRRRAVPIREVVVLDPLMRALSRQNQPSEAPQDRPVDSKVIVVAGKDGCALLELEAQNAQDAAGWLKSLRGSIALGSRTCSKGGWLSKKSLGTCRGQRPLWFVLHGSGLYNFINDSIGTELPELFTPSSSRRQGFIRISEVRRVEPSGGAREAKFTLHTSQRSHTLVAESATERDSWLEAVSRLAGLRETE